MAKINTYMYGLKIAGSDQVSFGSVPVLMVVTIIWSTEKRHKLLFVCREIRVHDEALIQLGIQHCQRISKVVPVANFLA